MPTPGIYRLSTRFPGQMYGSTIGPEIGRRDASLGAGTPQPFLSSNQWPERTPPKERPIRFQRWKQ